MSDSPVILSPIHRDELLARLAPFQPEKLAFEAGTYVEVTTGSELFELLTSFVATATSAKSFTFGITRENAHGDDDECSGRRVAVAQLGLGLHRFEWEDKPLYVLLQTLGAPVGGDCGATMYKNLCLISPRTQDIELLKRLCDTLIQRADRAQPSSFTLWRFSPQYQRWMRGEVVTARPIESVVLPAKTQAQLLSDLDDFLAKPTRAWYAEHGIPHKRSYLFHGAPGAGKTSTIQALAGRYGRNVCYLSLAHPDFTDDCMKAAIERVPAKSIIVLEDVDALFGERRAKKEGDKSPLTFSGLLNALDGVGGALGQVYILTTNHRERLDPALIRNGRVDVHIEFADATEEQMAGLFQQFYKGASDELAAQFATSLRAQLGDRSVSCAALQHFFIAMRKQNAETAAASASRVITEMEERAKTAAPKEAKAEAEGQPAEAKEESAEKGSAADGAAGDAADNKAGSGAGGEPVHVHLHLHK